MTIKVISKKFKKLLLSIIFIFFLNSNSNALEINHYTYSISGMFHDVTVAFEDLNKSSNVRCVIKKDGKPVAMKTSRISGVGTIQIHISGGITDTVVNCYEVD